MLLILEVFEHDYFGFFDRYLRQQKACLLNIYFSYIDYHAHRKIKNIIFAKFTFVSFLFNQFTNKLTLPII